MLATVEKITELKTHPNADSLDLCYIKGWQMCVKKDIFKVGDLVVYVQIDTILPKTAWSEFLVDKEKPDKPIRVKTKKLRGELSQGIVFPLSILPKGNYDVNQEVSEILGITKYIKEIPAQLRGEIKGNFPTHIVSKTDEERIQNIPEIIEEIYGKKVYISEKIDGTSVTFLYNKADNCFEVCSKNLSLKESESNLYWQMFKEYNFKSILEKYPNLVFQGEIIGNGIQSNPYKSTNKHLYIFNIYNQNGNKYLSFEDFKKVCRDEDLPTVPLIDIMPFNFKSVAELLKYAEGNSQLNKNTIREGIVIRLYDEEFSSAIRGRTSFKVISNEFALKYGE